MSGPRRTLVTGGAGFIGSALVRRLVARGWHVVTLDKLTYSGCRASLREVEGSPNHQFVQGDIGDGPLVGRLLAEHELDSIVHLAAETHVDRSIDSPAPFVETNVVGTFRLLETTLAHWRGLGTEEQARFRFLHVSTDEVFGDLPLGGGRFTEETPYRPSSPYAASKAASDHFARSWHATFGLPVLVGNCSNNYGPYQFPEKLIPLVILHALEGRPVPIYGRGDNVRDWLFVDDHAEALERILTAGTPGRSYNVGGGNERSNLAVAQGICDLLDKRRPLGEGRSRRSLIELVGDRPGHDLRYAIDGSRMSAELGWSPSRDFKQGLADTVDWYLANDWWWRPLRERYSGERLGRGP